MARRSSPRMLPRAAVVSKLAFYAALPVAMILASTLVGTSSYSGFVDTTTASSTWSTSSVSLTDDAAGAAILNDSNIQPGVTKTSCITVTNNSSVAAPVKIYAKNTGTDATLNQAINISIDEGTGGSFASCSGFVKQTTVMANQTLSTMETANTSYSTGLATGLTNPGATKTYQFSYYVPATAANKWQGLTSTNSFFWEAQN